MHAYGVTVHVLLFNFEKRFKKVFKKKVIVMLLTAWYTGMETSRAAGHWFKRTETRDAITQSSVTEPHI